MTIYRLACAASAVIDRAGGDLQNWVLGKLAELEAIQRAAMDEPQPNYRAAVEAIRVQLAARGQLSPRRAAGKVMQESQMTAEQLRAKLEEIQAKIDEGTH